MSFGGFGGRGGRNRQLRGGIGQPDPGEVFGPSSESADWLRRRGDESAPPAGAAAAARAAEKKLPTLADAAVVRPSGYWSLSVLPALDSPWLVRTWIVNYSAGSTGDNIIPPGWTVTHGRVMIVTGWCFFATAAGIGGITALLGVQSILPDTVSINAIETSFMVPGGPIATNQVTPSGTGGKGGAFERTGTFFNRGLTGESPVEIYIPGDVEVKGTYREVSTPTITPNQIGFTMEGYEVPAEEFYRAVSGPKR